MGAAMIKLNDTLYLTPEGGIAEKRLNKTGANSVKGTVIQNHSSVAHAFAVCSVGNANPTGIVYENGVADGSECLVVIYGVVDVLLENSTSATMGYWVKSSDSVAGRADATIASPPLGDTSSLDDHMQEIGHARETKSGGTDVLARINCHFN